MKIITENGIKQLEVLLKGKVLSSHLDKILSIQYNSKQELFEGEKLLTELRINFREGLKNILEVKQKDLIPLSEIEFKDQRYWSPPKSPKYFLCSEMEHQHLSNCIHFFDILLTLNRLTKEEIENYLQAIQENIYPELTERFNSELLTYQPKFDWESNLYTEYKKEKEKQEN